MISENKMKNMPRDTLLLAKGNSYHSFEELSYEIEIMDGMIKHAFPPKIIFASIPSGKIEELQRSSVVEFMTTDLIEQVPSSMSSDEFRDIISLWNKQVRTSRETKQTHPADEDLSWDAPGYLPPDPPPDIRKMMNGWEKKMEDDNHNK
jgi:hypothetical protein